MNERRHRNLAMLDHEPQTPIGPEPPEGGPGLPAAEVRKPLDDAFRREEVAERELALRLVEIDEGRLDEVAGYDDTAHYAEVLFGLGPEDTAELLRVGRKLLVLREVDRAFCEWRLSWGQVCLLTRVAVPEDESEWLDRALALGFRSLERLVERSERERRRRREVATRAGFSPSRSRPSRPPRTSPRGASRRCP
jgi:uncharacterized protein YciU (UPF0263 family)